MSFYFNPVLTYREGRAAALATYLHTANDRPEQGLYMWTDRPISYEPSHTTDLDEMLEPYSTDTFDSNSLRGSTNYSLPIMSEPTNPPYLPDLQTQPSELYPN